VFFFLVKTNLLLKEKSNLSEERHTKKLEDVRETQVV